MSIELNKEKEESQLFSIKTRSVWQNSNKN